MFEDIRTHGRTLRPRVAASLEGTGIKPVDFLAALSEAKLISVKRGRTGGIFYPSK